MANNPSKTWAKLATAGDHDPRAQTAGLAASYQSSKAAVVDDHQGSEPLERRQTDPARIDPATGEPIAALEVAQITDIDGAARARPALSDRAHVHRPGAARPRRGPH
ncbi:MAG TPA: hypothetical protein ENK57_12355 [Polyangiaceae bacterium]|nr:hypothetical protein [Polyangiaceae bacterium]